MGWQPNPYIVEGEAVAPQSGGLGAGRHAAGRPVLQGPGHKFSANLFVEKPLPPGSGAAEYIPVNFENKNIFL